MPKIAVLGFDPDLYDSGDLSAVLGKGKTLLNQKFKKNEQDDDGNHLLSNLMKQRLRAVLAISGQGDCYYMALSQHRLLKEYGHLHVRYTDMLHFVWEHAGKARMPGPPRYENIDLYESEICMHPWAQAAKQQKNGQWDFAVLQLVAGWHFCRVREYAMPFCFQVSTDHWRIPIFSVFPFMFHS